MNKDVVKIKAYKIPVFTIKRSCVGPSPSMRMCEVNKEKCSQGVQQLPNTAEHVRIQLSRPFYTSVTHTSYSVSATPTNCWIVSVRSQ